MKRDSVAVSLRFIEAVYALSALFVLTQGPVYRLWSESSGVVGRLPEPSVSQAHLASFIFVQLPGVALWLRRVDRKWLLEYSNRALIALISWLGLSVLWSAFARQSSSEFVALVFTTMFGLYLATSFSVRELWLVVASAMALGVVASWIAVMRLWESAVNFQEGYWTGIYYNRNSLAPVATVAIIAIVGVVFTSLTGPGAFAVRQRVLIGTASTVVLALAIVELWQSESKTSPIALAAAVVACVMWLLLRAVCGRSRIPKRIGAQLLPITFVVGGVALFFGLRIIGSSGAIPTDLATLSSRRGLWSLSWDGILEKPLLGWGWMAAWRTPEFFRSGDWWAAWNSVWSHNGYHDLLLGGGVVAGALFGLFLWFSSRNVGRGAPRVVVAQVLLIGFVLVAATQESFFLGSHFAWALLVATALASRPVGGQPTSSTPAR